MEQSKKIIEEFFKQELGEYSFTETDNLIEMGILDSFMFVELLEYLEEKRSKKIDLSSIDMNQFYSIETIAKTLES